MDKPRVTMVAQKTTTTADMLYSATCNMLDSGSGTVVIVGIGVRVTVVVRRDGRRVLSVGKVGESVRRDGR